MSPQWQLWQGGQRGWREVNVMSRFLLYSFSSSNSFPGGLQWCIQII
jgi:hypothetical protein